MSFLTDRVARMLFALPFGIFGIIHFMMGSDMAGMVPEFMPGDIIWIYLTGVAFLAASVSIVAQIQVKLTSLLLAFMLLVLAFTVHLPGDLAENAHALPNLLKDISLAGGALFLAGLYKDEPGLKY